MLFAVFVISVLATVGFAAYAGGALFGIRSSKVESFSVPPPPAFHTVSLPHPPPEPVRAARGTTPPPIPAAAAMPLPNIQRDTVPDLFKA